MDSRQYFLARWCDGEYPERFFEALVEFPLETAEESRAQDLKYKTNTKAIASRAYLTKFWAHSIMRTLVKWPKLSEACGKTFTKNCSLHKHRKYHCPNLETENAEKEACPGCGKMLYKTTVYKNVKNGCVHVTVMRGHYVTVTRDVTLKGTNP